MASPPIITPTSAMVTACIDGIVADMPAALQPIQTGGFFAAVPTIVESQTDVALARLADEVQSARLRYSTGASLRELCASEFNLSIQPAPQSAYATLLLGRGKGSMPAGVVKAGQIFSQASNPNATPVPIQAATYKSLQTVYVPAGATLVVLPCTAVTPGNAANVPTFTNTTAALSTTTADFEVPPFGTVPSAITVADQTPFTVGLTFKAPGYGYFWVKNLTGGTVNVLPSLTKLGSVSPYGGQPNSIIPSGTALYPGNLQIQSTIPLFDPNLTVIDCDASGGSPGITDPGLVAAARANAIGQYGPTDGALVAGVLTEQSVVYYAFFRATATIPYAQGYVADDSWASSGLGLGSGTSWTDSIAAAVTASQQGFGCRVRWGQVVNLLTAVSCSIYLKTTEALAYTQTIDQNVRTAIRSYFDDRQDWYIFRLKGLGAAIRSSDPNIQQVQSVVVSDAVSGATLSEPTTPGVAAWSSTLVHYYIGTADSDQTVTTQYFPPA